VGDPQQAIYGWNGADARFITDIRTYYPPAEVIVLDRNYRSTPQILSAASSVLAAARLDVHDVEATLGDGGTPLVERYDTDAEEALGVARAVRDLHAPGAPWSAQAVLVRTHNQTKLLLDALRSAGIPARVRGTASLLDRREVRKVVDAMRASNAPLATFLPDLEMPDAANDDGDDVGVDDDVRAALEQIAELGRDHLRLQPDAKASMFAAWLFASTSGDATDRNDAVDVATFHAAKGLEWPIVHLAGLEDGYVPVTHARSRPARAEEARLLYVAMTRAEQTLRCTWAGQRAFGAKILERQVSPFLRPLVDVGRQHAAQDPRQRAHADPEWRAHVAAQRAVLAAATQPQSPEHEALRRWRDDAARAARIDPESVLTERVLHAVASAHPSDVDALAAISGVGSLLAARFGDGILAALAGVSAR
jgi:DNA helicase-2/ATP-dependent DNA helicase PcrA